MTYMKILYANDRRRVRLRVADCCELGGLDE